MGKTCTRLLLKRIMMALCRCVTNEDIQKDTFIYCSMFDIYIHDLFDISRCRKSTQN